ncbi:putative RNA polymerase II subunit B1 CTD phosphatase rpap2 isoform 1 [Silurus meridionalis]|nr:putative RNA polymerase II subunit B1 CTD phosphatase rpap2 isoform 1 [Silurus meridionalis]
MDAGGRRRARVSRAKTDGKAAQVRRSAEEEARRKEILKESLRERLELERRALQVVERLLDDSVTEDFLVDCARLITPANYRDAVEERSIAKMCGYPVCSNKLVNVPRQRFKISTKTNKVYEITERKCFCCNFCYKASKYLEVQISKSPLWLRKEERPSEVKLLKKGDGGTSGLEVKLSDRHVTTSDIENPIPESTGSHRGIGDGEESGDGGDDEEEEEQGFVSSVVSRPQQQHRRHVHWGDLPRQGGDKQQTCEGDPQTSGARSERETRSDGAQVSQAISDSLSVEETSNVLDQVALSDSDGTSLNISRVGMSKQTAAGLRNLLKSSGKTRAEAPVVTLSLMECLTRTLMEWRTEETARFLCGPGSTSYAEAEPQSDGDEEELDEDDLEDVEKVKCSGDAASAAAPDYETLRRETQMLELQVHEFYRGECVLPEKVQTHTEDRENVPPLPLVDSRAQRAIQRSIVVKKLCRSLEDIIGPLGVTMSEIINDINSVLRTFSLAEVSPSLRESMTRTCSVDYISSLMKELGLKDEDLQSLVKLLRPPRNACATVSATECRVDS